MAISAVTALALAVGVGLAAAGRDGDDGASWDWVFDVDAARGIVEPGRVLWDGAFEVGGVPPGANGSSCGTGGSVRDIGSDQYASVEELGNTDCTSSVELTSTTTRTPDSERSLKVVIGPNQQRVQPQSTFAWVPDDKGTVDQWFGISMYYDADWNLGGGLTEEVSAEYWHNPIAWRTEGENGSLNFSGDMDLNNGNGESYEEFSEPHMVLRRNTVMNDEGFYEDGQGLDKIDLGPIVTNEWMDFVCHIRWSTTSTNALRECWRDGVYMGARTSLNAVDTNIHHFRVGQYQTTSIDHERTTYIDNVRIGTSYLAVDPSRVR